MPPDKQHNVTKSALTEWVKLALFIAGFGLIFGANAALGIVNFYGRLIAGLFFCFLLWVSIRWVFKKTEQKAGLGAAVAAMFFYILIALPLLGWLIGLFR
ncbi:hypothetical protein MTYM_00971 [Methylococcales bacterium]|nr:hypothetical protein MTYM_00971 [Methylococcales bacterium]